MPIDMTKLDRFPRQILVLAPHPDDFDAIGITLKYFHDRGCDIHLAIVSTGVSGVDDDACERPTLANKIALRRQEQLAACEYFGLPRRSVTFLPLEEDQSHHPADSAANLAIIRRHLESVRPDTVFLPHGNDKNATHRQTFDFLRRSAVSVEFPVTAYLNRDPKTIAMWVDRYMPFHEEQAAWKAALLRHHVSQQKRNMKTRGYGFDERILRMNRESANDLALAKPYAEVFEIQHFNERTTS